jgi:hypothetical protein
LAKFREDSWYEHRRRIAANGYRRSLYHGGFITKAGFLPILEDWFCDPSYFRFLFAQQDAENLKYSIDDG